MMFTDDTRHASKGATGLIGVFATCIRRTEEFQQLATPGCRTVRGDFVALLDSDDVWMPWKLELQLACLDCCGRGMIWTT